MRCFFLLIHINLFVQRQTFTFYSLRWNQLPISLKRKRHGALIQGGSTRHPADEIFQRICASLAFSKPKKAKRRSQTSEHKVICGDDTSLMKF